MPQALTKKYGPLPGWAWLLILSASALWAYRRQVNKQAETSLPNDPNATPNMTDTADPTSYGPIDQSGLAGSPTATDFAGQPYYGGFPLGGGSSDFLGQLPDDSTPLPAPVNPAPLVTQVFNTSGVSQGSPPAAKVPSTMAAQAKAKGYYGIGGGKYVTPAGNIVHWGGGKFTVVGKVKPPKKKSTKKTGGGPPHRPHPKRAHTSPRKHR